MRTLDVTPRTEPALQPPMSQQSPVTETGRQTFVKVVRVENLTPGDPGYKLRP